jgi:hypothetical protein
MGVLRVQLLKEQLLLLPVSERALFLMLGHIANELNAVSRLCYWAATSPERDGTPEGHGQFSTVLLLLRILAGQLNESWEFLQARFFKQPELSATYGPMLGKEVPVALRSLKNYFGKENAARIIRNFFAFHYGKTDLAALLPDIDDDLILYLDGESAPNNLFYVSEIAVGHTLLAALGRERSGQSFKPLVDELLGAAEWFMEVAFCLIHLITKKNQSQFQGEPPTEAHFDRLDPIEEIRLPWFTDASGILGRLVPGT